MAEQERSWSFVTNWTVVHGSLQNSVFFESPIHPISEENSTFHESLVLEPTPDSDPCEITISFKQSHEVQQVYVRSTARVYEIYYSPKQSSDNDYLCTVRCGECSTEATEPPEEITKNDITHSSNEDGWVEVKLPALLDDAASSSLTSTKVAGKTGTNTRAFYEATAEITDAYPCVSITLRLLSLQTKGFVCVEEIYVFAEPVELTDSGGGSGPAESSGESLLAMLVPSLLQLSKTDFDRTRNKHVSDIKEKLTYQDRGSKATEPTSTKVMKNLPEPDEQTVGSGSKAMPISKDKNLPDYRRLENVLEKLADQVERVEALCLRVEEKIVEPLGRMEMRLQRLEQQVDKLAEKYGQFGSNQCLQFRAPEFPNDGSESISLDCDNNRNDLEQGGGDDSELMGKVVPIVKTRMSVNDAMVLALTAFSATASASARAPDTSPSLIVTAPEFSIDDDDDAFVSTARAPCGGSNDPCWGFLITVPKFSSDDDNADGDDALASSSARAPCKRTKHLHPADGTDSDFTDVCCPSMETLAASSHVSSPSDTGLQNEATVDIAAAMDPATETDAHGSNGNANSKTHFAETDDAGPDFELPTLQPHLTETSKSGSDLEHSILDVKFVPEANWKAGMPLEALLGDLALRETQGDGEELKECIVNEQFLLDVEEINVPSEGDEELKDTGASSSSQPYTNLI